MYTTADIWSLEPRHVQSRHTRDRVIRVILWKFNPKLTDMQPNISLFFFSYSLTVSKNSRKKFADLKSNLLQRITPKWDAVLFRRNTMSVEWFAGLPSTPGPSPSNRHVVSIFVWWVVWCSSNSRHEWTKWTNWTAENDTNELRLLELRHLILRRFIAPGGGVN